MNTLRRGSAGTDVSILQLALKRAGFDPGKPDGIFGEKTLKAVTDFQRRNGLVPDGIAGEKTWNALTPYLTGYIVHTIESGDTFYLLAQKYGTTTEAIFTANPGTDAENLPIGANLTVPLGFPLVTGEINFTYTLLKFTLEGLAARYPFISGGSIGKSVGGREQYYLKMGSGQKRVMFNAAHHANEWITVPTVLKFFEQYAESYSKGESIYGADARNLFENVTLYIVPMVNPDGVELVTGALTAGQPEYEQAKAIAARYPAVEFPNGWKANIAGYDLNLNYPAGWE
ncbi:MAG: peptidoglycan-binding protein, partial [Clostridia bacterium]|nr:peptidoglycan-binding protein [Clostridia bacterium]